MTMDIMIRRLHMLTSTMVASTRKEETDTTMSRKQSFISLFYYLCTNIQIAATTMQMPTTHISKMAAIMTAKNIMDSTKTNTITINTRTIKAPLATDKAAMLPKANAAVIQRKTRRHSVTLP
jgi:hypothetical protein